MTADFTLKPAAEIHLWRAELDSNTGGPSKLPAEDRERAARLLRPQSRRRWIAARWALRTVLGRYLEVKPEQIELQLGPHGKPSLAPPGDPLRFNLSHSRELALIAVARDREIGVDVEWIDPRRDVLALADRALGPMEAAKLQAMPVPARSAAFHAAWARREAIAKCAGVGLGKPLPEAAVAAAALDAPPGFAAAIAVSGDALPPLRHFTVQAAHR